MSVALRRLIASVDNGVWGSDPGKSEIDVWCIRAADFDFPRLRVDMSRTPLRGIDRTTFRRLALRRGDIVLEKSGGGDLTPVGRAVSYDDDRPAVTSNFAARVRAAVGVDPRFLAYLLQSLYASGVTLKCIKQTTGIQNLDTAHWLETRVEQPDLGQQRRIAEFLNDRVARIDQITTAREAQMTLVQSQLEALAESAFSCGEVAHGPWVRLASACAFFSDGDWIESPHVTSHGIRLIQTGNVAVGEYKEQGFRYISEETFTALKCTRVLEGDVLISRLASPVARACICPQLGPAIASVDVVIARPKQWLNTGFLVEYLSSPRHLSDAEELARGATMQRVSRSQLGSVRVPCPDMAVQGEVASALAAARDARNRSLGDLNRFTSLMQEYKQSLITAAVTGELDVTTAGSGIPG